MTGRILNFRPPASRPVEPAPQPNTGQGAAGAVDTDRFRRQVLPHLDGAYSFARYLCRDASAAEDIVQEAFLRAYRGFGGLRGEDARAWLFSIVRNCVFSWSQSDRARSALFTAVPDEPEPPAQNAETPETPETQLIRSAEITTVRQAIDALPEPFRETLVLRELEELSYRDIAAVTGAPIGTVMSRLARARGMLAAALGAGETDQESRP